MADGRSQLSSHQHKTYIMSAQSTSSSKDHAVSLPSPPGDGGPKSSRHDRPLEISLMAAHLFIVNLFYTCAKTAFVDFQNAESALAFYGVYHREPLNQVIHFFGVPLILWTLLVFTAHMVLPPIPSKRAPPPVIIPRLPGIPAHYMTWATLWVLLYVAFYLKIDYIGALLYMPFLYMYYATAVRWTRNDQEKAWLLASKDKTPATVSWMGTRSLISWACFLQVFAWYVQVSKKCFGGRSQVVSFY
jgi:uncharacterized membrane protein YGL010W